jgi:hypothetical protein
MISEVYSAVPIKLGEASELTVKLLPGVKLVLRLEPVNNT